MPPSPEAQPERRLERGWLAPLLITCLLAGGGLWYESGRRASWCLAQAERAAREGAQEVALDRYQQAMRAYAPLLSAPWLAKRRLEELASEGLSRGDEGRSLAIGALSRLRGAAWATQGLLKPYAEQLPQWNEELAALLAAQDHALGLELNEPTEPLEELRKLHLQTLRRDPRPPLPWSLCLSLGLLLSLTGVIGLIWRGFNARLEPSPSLPIWSLITLLGCVTWLTALALMPL